MRSDFDVVVLGQGLAGTALAWQLRWSGLKPIVIDRESNSTSSRIAAGLMTPITGQKLVRGWNLAKLWPSATEFYRRVEQSTGSNFFRQGPMVRLFCQLNEVALFQSRLASGEFGGLVRLPDPLVDEQSFATEYGGFEMSPGGQLDVREYLRASKDSFSEKGEYLPAEIDVSREIELRDGQIQIPSLGIVARWIVFCQGIDAIHNPWFRDVRFKPAKGEILGLRIPGLIENRVIHRRIWLAPIGGELFKVGSTYDWNHLDCQPTHQGHDEIVSELRQLLRLPFEVISHEAAVRPIHRNQHPVIGIHPVHNQLAYFNGLGSKGSLQSPFYARQLVNLMAHGTPVDPDVDLNRKTDWQSNDQSDLPVHPGNPKLAFHVKRQASRRLTEQAQDVIRSVLRKGDFAIDATAGNGYDTQFLAELVGSSGRVFAFDIQPGALQKSASRLAELSLQNVVLLNENHDRMAEFIPPELHGQIRAIMFNLGYLPGGDKQIKTNAESTQSAIKQAAELIGPGGTMTIVSYTGHDGGQLETAVVQQELNQLSQNKYQIEAIKSMPGRTSGPLMFIVKRESVTAQ